MIALFRSKSVPVTHQCLRYALPVGKSVETSTKGYVYCYDVTYPGRSGILINVNYAFQLLKQGIGQSGKSSPQELR